MNDIHFLGIDPGTSGAFALIDNNLSVVNLQGFPGEEQLVKNLKLILEPYTHNGIITGIWSVIENVHSMPGQSSVSTFTFGRNFGFWIGVLSAWQIPIFFVTPQRWQKGLVPKVTDKKEHKENLGRVAGKIFPRAEIRGPRGGLLDGRSDALLIAKWLRDTHYRGENQ